MKASLCRPRSHADGNAFRSKTKIPIFRLFMMSRRTLVPSLIFFVGTSPAFGSPLPAFPGATGFGTTTVAGSGRDLLRPGTTIYRIRSLADSGQNTLRECISGSGPRTCLFETSGRIALKDLLWINNPYITIAGQTAPEPGILLTGAPLVIATHDVLLRHLAIRVGDDPNGPRPNARDGITIHGKGHDAFNIVIDHVSVSWALDENMSTYGNSVRDVTVMNSILSEGLYHSIHPDGPHSMGMLIGEGTQRISVHHSLFALNNDRNPRQKAGTSLEFMNNLVYGWGGWGNGHTANPADTNATGDETLLNFAGNCYRPAPASPRSAALWGKPLSARFRVYVSQNLGPTRASEDEDEWRIAGIPQTPFRTKTPAFPLSGVPTQKPSVTCEQVLIHAGTRPGHRNSVDQRVVEQARSGTGSLRDCIFGCEKNVGGWPQMAVNIRALHVPIHPTADTDRNGYTDLEDWLNCLAQSVEGSRPESACQSLGGKP